MAKLLSGIEAGGTNFVCAVGDAEGNVLDKTTLPTRAPEETFQDVKEFFSQHDIEALGVGGFGPIDLDEESPTYGTILNTPKIKWQQVDLLGRLKQDMQVPVKLTTDVNAAALGEYRFGTARDVKSCLYITVGTGIGGGFIHEGKPYTGKDHPEMGHIMLARHEKDTFPGSCPFHGACLEGLASGTAIEARYGKKGIELTDDPEVWEIEAYYLAQAVMNYLLILSPERIILGGGVMKQPSLLPLIREKFIELFQGYRDITDVEKLIVAPALNGDQGILGAMELVNEE